MALLDAGADPNLRGKDELTALHLAARVGHRGCIESLILAGADKNAKAKGYTPLHDGIRANHLESVLFLLRYGADAGILTPDGQSYVEFALSCGAHANIVKLLAGEIPVQPELTPTQVEDFLSLVAQGELEECDKLMKQNVEFVVSRSKSDYTAIFTAALQDVKSIELFVEHGASPTALGVLRPIHIAAISNFEAFSYLYSLGGTAFEQPIGYAEEELVIPTMMFAGIMGITTGVTIAHECGLKPEKLAYSRQSILHVAAAEGKINTLKVVLELFVPDVLDVDELGYRGYNPLHSASELGKLTCVIELLRAGARTDIKNKQGHTALDLARLSGHTTVAEVIEKHMRGEYTEPLTEEQIEEFASLLSVNEVPVIYERLQENPQYYWAESQFVKPVLYTMCEIGQNDVVDHVLTVIGPNITSVTDFNVPVIMAASKSFNEIVDRLVSCDFDVNAREPNNEYTALHYACRQGNHLLARLLFLSKETNPNLAAGNGKKPIHLATELGDLNLVEILTQGGVDINSRIDNDYKVDAKMRGYTPLHIAISNNDLASVTYLIEAGADVTMKTYGPLKYRKEYQPQPAMSCLELAQKKASKTIQNIIRDVERLVTSGLNQREAEEIRFDKMMKNVLEDAQIKEVTWRDKLKYIFPKVLPREQRDSFLERLYDFQYTDNVTQLNATAWINELKQHPQLVIIREVLTTNSLAHVAASTNVMFGEALIENGASFTLRNKKMERPIHCAAAQGNVEYIKYLVSKGEDINVIIEDDVEYTPLMVAIASGMDKCVVALVELGANIFAVNASGNSAIHIAAEKNQPEIIQLLIHSGESVNRRVRARHITPLHSAVASRAISSVITLLYHGADINAKTSSASGNQTPLEYAQELSMFKSMDYIIKLLEKAQNGEQPLKPISLAEVEKCIRMVYQGQVEELLQFINEHNEVAYSTLEWPFIHHVVQAKCAPVLRRVLELGVDPFVESPDGVNTLHRAAYSTEPEMIEILLEFSPDMVNQIHFNYEHGSAMHVAVRSRNVRNVIALLKHGMHPQHMYNANGVTPTHLAAVMNDLPILKVILEGTPEKPTTELERYFRIRAPGKQACYGLLPVHSSVESMHDISVFKYLLEQGSPIRFPNYDSPNLYEMAVHLKSKPMIDIVTIYLAREIEQNMGGMLQKTQFCDIDIIVSTIHRVLERKEISQEEKNKQKMIDQFNSLGESEKLVWYQQATLKLEQLSLEEDMYARMILAASEQSQVVFQDNEANHVKWRLEILANIFIARSRELKKDFYGAIEYITKVIKLHRREAAFYGLRMKWYLEIGDTISANTDKRMIELLESEKANFQDKIHEKERELVRQAQEREKAREQEKVEEKTQEKQEEELSEDKEDNSSCTVQ